MKPSKAMPKQLYLFKQGEEKTLEKKIEQAIRLIKSAAKIATEHGQPIEVCYSGGKDSDIILELTKMADVEYRAIYKNTTIDPPHTIMHCKRNGVEVMRPGMTFQDVILKSGLPSRYRRSCCDYLKEYKVLDYAILGVRRTESKKRAEMYKEPELCRHYKHGKKARQYFPILEWTDTDVADFIKLRGIKCHPIYYDAYGRFHAERRLGCMGCPLMSKNGRIEEFKHYPNMVKFYVKNGQRYLDTHPQSKINKLFADAYEWFVMSLFCDNMEQFKRRFGANSLNKKTDCKLFLENYFGIKF